MSSKHDRESRGLSSRRLMALAAAAAVLVLAIVGFLIWKQNQDQQDQDISAGHQVNVGSGIQHITYRGKQYAYNNRITSILLIGIDSEGVMSPLKRYTIAPRADSISLLVLDEMHKKMTIIALSRDTMTEIRRYTMNGRDRGLFVDHLGYAYTYGDGWDVSCRNVCEAVSNLFYGIPIGDYVVMNRSSLPLLAKALGALEVTVPNDDLAELGYTKGQTAMIDETNLESFVRSRDTQQDLSNVGRMERQQAYINAAAGVIRYKAENEPSALWDTVLEAESCVHTNITHSRYLNLVKILKNTAYDAGNYYVPEGRQVIAADHDEFYPDEETLLKQIISIFYLEK